MQAPVYNQHNIIYTPFWYRKASAKPSVVLFGQVAHPFWLTLDQVFLRWCDSLHHPYML